LADIATRPRVGEERDQCHQAAGRMLRP
jgi:hypothetical protein